MNNSIRARERTDKSSMVAASGIVDSSQTTPQISVLMTVYNDHPPFVREAIDSILNQTFTDFEFVVVSDGTTRADLIELLNDVAATDLRIHLFWAPHRGLTGSLNAGLSFCRAPLICRQDADDWSDPQRLAKQYEFMGKNPGIAVVGTAVELCQEMGQKLWVYSLPCEPVNVMRSFPSENPFCHGAICFRASAANEVGRFNPMFRCAQDYDFLWRLCERFSGANLPDVLYRHRRSPGSMVSQMNVLLARERMMARLLASQRERGEVEDAASVIKTAARLISGKGPHFRLGIADQQLLAGRYLAALRSYSMALARAPYLPKAYLKALRWLLFVLAPSWRARLFGH